MDKWKTFPCKDCLIKRVCKKECFEVPDLKTLTCYSEKHGLVKKCLGCGEETKIKHSHVPVFACHNCHTDIV